MTLEIPTDFAEQFEREGYVVLPNFSSEAELDDLRQRMAALVDAYDPTIDDSVFSTESHQQAKNEFFLTSGNVLRMFLEEEAKDPATGALKQAKGDSINKCGHALHALEPGFRRLCADGRAASVVRALGYEKPQVVQSMYIFKPPHIGGPVKPHQDSTFVHTKPETCVGLWVPLDDSTLENGCLWVVKGSHKRPIVAQFVLNEDRTAAVFRPAGGPTVALEENDEWTAVPLQRGSCLVFSGNLVHKSDKNTSENQRHAMSWHIIDGVASWDTDNWLDRGYATVSVYDEPATASA